MVILSSKFLMLKKQDLAGFHAKAKNLVFAFTINMNGMML